MAAGVDPAPRGRRAPAYPHPGRRRRRRRRRPRQRLPGHRRVRRPARPSPRRRRRPSRSSHAVGQPAEPRPEPPEEFSEDVLLSAAQVVRPRARSALDRDRDRRQHRGQRPGPALPADPVRRPARRRRAGPRVRHARPPRQQPEVAAVEVAELSRTPRGRAAGLRHRARLVRRLRGPRAQLMSTQRVDGVGDEAMLFELKKWGKVNWTYVAGVARTGAITTTTLTRSTADQPADLRGSARLLAEAVNGVCGQPDAGACATRAQAPSSRAGARWARCPGMLVRGRPAAGRRGAPALGRHRAAPGHGQRRVDLLRRRRLRGPADEQQRDPHVRDPRRRAAGAVRAHPDRRHHAAPGARRRSSTEIRNRMAACPDQDLGTEVGASPTAPAPPATSASGTSPPSSATTRSVSYLMGIVRDGTAVAQVGFVPDATGDDGAGALHRAGRAGRPAPPGDAGARASRSCAPHQASVVGPRRPSRGRSGRRSRRPAPTSRRPRPRTPVSPPSSSNTRQVSATSLAIRPAPPRWRSRRRTSSTRSSSAMSSWRTPTNLLVVGQEPDPPGRPLAGLEVDAGRDPPLGQRRRVGHRHARLLDARRPVRGSRPPRARRSSSSRLSARNATNAPITSRLISIAPIIPANDRL